jgi:hypothetical protein
MSFLTSFPELRVCISGAVAVRQLKILRGVGQFTPNLKALLVIGRVRQFMEGGADCLETLLGHDLALAGAAHFSSSMTIGVR